MGQYWILMNGKPNIPCSSEDQAEFGCRLANMIDPKNEYDVELRRSDGRPLFEEDPMGDGPEPKVWP